MKKILFFTILLFVVGEILYSQSIPNSISKLSLKDALDLGIKNDYSVKQQELRMNSLEWDKNHSWNYFLPGLTASIQASDNYYTNRINESHGYTAGASANFNINADIFKRIEIIKAEYKNGRLSYENYKNQVYRNISQLYYNIVYLRERLALENELIKTEDELLRIIGEKKAVKNFSEIELHNYQINLDRSKIYVKEYEKQLSSNLMSLVKQLGIENISAIELEGTCEDYKDFKSIEFNKNNLS